MAQDLPGFSEDKRPGNDNRASKIAAAASKVLAKPRQLSWSERWSETQVTKTAAFWSGLGAIALILILGFNWGGWMTSGSAAKLAATTASTAVLQRLGPICVAQSQLDPAKEQKLTELKALSSYQQSDYVGKQGWATLPGEAKPDSKVAGACAKLLTQTN